MWIFDENGYYSVGADTQDSSRVMVRARARGDLLHLEARFGGPIIDTRSKADYEWRISVPKAGFGEYVAEQVGAVDYTKFKTRVEERLGKRRYHILLGVWTKLLEIAPDYVPYRGFEPHGRRSGKITRETTMFGPVMETGVDEYDIFETIPGDSECCGAIIAVVAGQALCAECGEDAFA
jgi:hypothetical protein